MEKRFKKKSSRRILLSAIVSALLINQINITPLLVYAVVQEELTQEEVAQREELTQEEVVQEEELTQEEVVQEEELTQEEVVQEEELTQEEVVQEEELTQEEVVQEEELTQEEVVQEEISAQEEVVQEEISAQEEPTQDISVIQFECYGECKEAVHTMYSEATESADIITKFSYMLLQDAMYLDQTEEYYKVYVNGIKGWVKKYELQDNTLLTAEPRSISDATIISKNINELTVDPSEINNYLSTAIKPRTQTINLDFEYLIKTSQEIKDITNPSTYRVEEGELQHCYTTAADDVVAPKYCISLSDAPSYLKEGKTYYSYDGVYFYNNMSLLSIEGENAVNKSTPFYNYFQYLPSRSASNYVTKDFILYLNLKGYNKGFTQEERAYLTTLEKVVKDGKTYQDIKYNNCTYKSGKWYQGTALCSMVQNKSMLLNDINSFKEHEFTYGFNSLMELSWGIHESLYGTSPISIAKNNFYGMNAIDRDPMLYAYTYETAAEGNMSHIDLFSYRWSHPIDHLNRYFGSHLGVGKNHPNGDIATGINTLYASDPQWGEKIAAHMYKADQALGAKDLNYYTIGIAVESTGLKVLDTPSNTGKVLYNAEAGDKTWTKNYPVLIVGEEGDYYKIKTDTPFTLDKKFYSTKALGVKYDWKSESNITYGYVHKSYITAFTGDTDKNYRDPKDVAYRTRLPYLGIIDSPSNGATVKGTIDIKGWYVYGGNIERIEIYVDGVKQGNASRIKRPDVQQVYPEYDASEAGYLYTLNTSKLSNGIHELKVVAVGSDGTKSEIKRSFKVNKLGYLGVIDSPTAEESVRGNITIKGWYLYGGSIDRIEVYVDGIKQGNASRYGRGDVQQAYPQYDASKAGYSYTLNTSKLSTGMHELKIVAVGLDGTKNELKRSFKVNKLGYLGVIDSPTAGANVRGNITIKGWYLYGGSIDRIEVYVDGIKQGNASRYGRGDVQQAYPQYDASEAGYSYTVNTSKLSTGTHELKIVAVGSDGTKNELKRSFKVNNLGYLGVIDSPTAGASVRGNITIKGWYLYGGSIDRIEVYVDGIKQGNASRYGRGDVQQAYPQYDASKAGYSYTLNTSKLSNGTHELKIVAVGSDGTKNELKRSFKVNKLGYLGVIDSPTAGANVKGTIEIKGWYLYGADIDRIEVYVDGVKQGNASKYSRGDVQQAYPQYDASKAGYSYTLNTSKLSNGTHELKIVAVGSDGTKNELKRSFMIRR